MERRPPVPPELRRKILVEAGHRCAIPTCRNTEIEVAHIIPWAQVKEHTYENLIALCPICHKRADDGKIDRKSLYMYKRILQRLTDRYERFELLVLNELRQGNMVTISENMTLLVKNLVDDKLITLNVIPLQGFENNLPLNMNVLLTKTGNAFIEEWINGNKELTYWR